MKCPVCGGQCGPFICTQNVDRSEISEVERAREQERAAIVAYLRERANADEMRQGVPVMSPAGRGLLLLMADRIEREEHLKGER